MIRNAKYTNEFVSDPGSRYHTLYKSTVLPSGEVILKENGKEDIWEKINAEAPSCDMQYILHQMALGDYSALDHQTQYLDLTQMPTSRREVLDIFMNVEKEFLSLPSEVRMKFDNDFRKWYASGDTPEWREAMKEVLPVVEEKKEVIENAVQE